MKKYKKILSIFIIVIILFSITNVVLGDFTSRVSTDKELQSTAEVRDKFNDVIGIMQVIAVGLAVIMLIVLAIKYMVSSVGDRAEIKKHAVVYGVGAVILFGTTGILQIIKAFAESIPS